MTHPLIEARELHAHYGQSHVLQGVTLSVARGESVGLLGRNGMGKTTLIRTLLGLVRASGGSVSVAGRDMSGAPTEKIVRHGIGYVPEGRGIFPNLSVRDNLLMGARSGTRGQRDWTLERVLATFPRLAERLSNGGAQLSGGEQQMLAIGRALMTNPDLVILDEATEGLAPLVVAEIWRTIGEIRASGIASLVVDRNYRAVLAHTDRAVVLEKGRIVLAGPSDSLASDLEALRRHLGV
ncbi:ABC transporter ATP-binding protein [Burkholderiaceae bacterium FT117]|uniref:ABC transporter ATP-binding protein n=1 Tax=Zeimonas sediminis TaxID=2944268 RepID=UPI002342E6FD|nr:ABC transporter ATP-binding protein [Zeimonas sediminis]MCM5569057.1 ABC transporter ATP-binding protein [Zeimonas sediminis]